eukprot:CAMPEP_0196661418 /NCGR_PEP_ID=MMETSP1086-20130531/44183_1 /TAXON_ID=77921 /ORGANISM="Cyanoptyche  gloeocystis , Strain SAG4.97" /LENGTH=55 /DNA_ID=CAMNT_0041996299 /DNA_START=411 /DNA_END=578 /DNA_ORIENTATION=-
MAVLGAGREADEDRAEEVDEGGSSSSGCAVGAEVTTGTGSGLGGLGRLYDTLSFL